MAPGHNGRVPQLIRPTVRHRASFAAAMREFEEEGRGAPEDLSSIGRDIRRLRGRWEDPEVFAAYVAQTVADAREDSPRPAGQVPCTTLWYVSGDRYLGRIAIRHRLNAMLLDYGGHIGYDVRPSARRRGHATAMLRAVLPVAHRLGIDPVLVTCDDTNTASRKVIEAAGGRFEDQRAEKLRYWISTAPAQPGNGPAAGE